MTRREFDKSRAIRGFVASRTASILWPLGLTAAIALSVGCGGDAVESGPSFPYSPELDGPLVDRDRFPGRVVFPLRPTDAQAESTAVVVEYLSTEFLFEDLPRGPLPLRPVPEGTIVDTHPAAEVDGARVRSAHWPVVVVLDVRPLSSDCHAVLFPRAGYQNAFYTWPRREPPPGVRVSVEGAARLRPESTDSTFDIEVPVTPAAVRIRVAVSDDGSAPMHSSCTPLTGAPWAHSQNPSPSFRRDVPVPERTLDVDIDRPGRAAATCTVMRQAHRGCLDFWAVPRPDLVTTTTITVVAS